MKFQEIKDKLLTNSLLKGVVYGVLGTLALELVILLIVFAFRAGSGVSAEDTAE